MIKLNSKSDFAGLTFEDKKQTYSYLGVTFRVEIGIDALGGKCYNLKAFTPDGIKMITVSSEDIDRDIPYIIEYLL